MRVNVPKKEGRTLVGAMLGFAIGVAGVVDWLEDVEAGAEPMRAAKKAYRKATRRRAALKKVEEKAKEPVFSNRDNVIDVTPEVERRRASR